MGASHSLIDEVHTASQLPDSGNVKRKLAALHTVQDLGRSPVASVQIIEQGGLQPLLACYNSQHPTVRVEAARALAALARQPINQCEMGHDDVLPLLLPSLMTGDEEFKEHAMDLLAELSTPAPNKTKLVHEGLLGPIIADLTASRPKLQLHALLALGRLCEVAQVSVLATQRGALVQLLRAARCQSIDAKLGVVRVLANMAAEKENLSELIASVRRASSSSCVVVRRRRAPSSSSSCVVVVRRRRRRLTTFAPSIVAGSDHLHDGVHLHAGRAAGAGGALPLAAARPHLWR